MEVSFRKRLNKLALFKFALFVICYLVPLAVSQSTIYLTLSSSGQIHYFTTLPLYIDGKYVKNSQGLTVTLKGVNKGFLLSTGLAWIDENGWDGLGVWDENIVRFNLQEMKSWGVNVMRSLIWVDWWLDNYQGSLYGHNPPITYREAIKRSIELAAEYGIYVVISPWGVKAAEGNAEHFPIPPYSKSDSQTILPTVQSWVDFWVDVATELGGYPNVLFELQNEPYADAVGDAAIPDWFNVSQQAIDAIRAIPRDNIIIVQWGYAGGVYWLRRSDLPNGTNILYSTHIYRAHGTFENNEYTYDGIYNQLYYPHEWRGDYSYAVENNIPLWIGEIGCWESFNPTPEERQYFNNTLYILNGWEMGYAAWNWKISMGDPFGLLADANYLSPSIAGQILINAIQGY